MLGGAVLILLAMVGLAYREWSQYSSARALDLHRRDVRNSVESLLAGLLDAETGQRGFLLTGEDRYLEPYNRAIQVVPAELANLSRLLGLPQGRPDPDLARLNGLVDQKLAELRATIDLRRQQGVAPAVEVVLGDRGKQAMDEIRDICSAIGRQAESERTEAQTQILTSARGSLLVTAFGSLFLLIVLVAAYLAIGKQTLDREQALAEAQIARDSLRTTLRSIGDAVISTDREGRVEFANGVAQSLLRTPEADVTGKPLDDVFRIVNEFTRASVESPVTKVLREGTIVGLANHTVLIARDGTEIPIDDSGAPIRDEAGNIRGTVLVFRDITARRRAEENQRLLAAIVESSDDAIVSKDLNGVITSWNQGAERMFGYSAAEAIGQPVSIIAAPGRDEMPGILARIREGERIEHYETIRRTKSGDILNVSLTVSPVRDAEGRIVGASKIVRDITERVRAAEQLARSNEETQKARDSLRTTLASIGDAVLSTDTEGRIVFANPVAQALLRWPEAELVGKHLDEVFRIVNEETRAKVESPVAKVLREGAIVGLANHTVLIARDGTEIPIDDSGAPIRGESGAVQGTVLVFRDITDRRRADNALRVFNDALQRSNEDLQRFAFVASHDLQEPLRMITTYAQLLIKSYPGQFDNDARMFVANIVEGTKRMRELLADLLAYTEIGSHPDEPAEPVNLNLILGQVLQNLKASIDEAGAIVTSDPLPTLNAHAAHFISLFQNLIGNAIKYRSVRPPQVHISVHAADGQLQFAVADNGIGIDPKYQGQIFEVFKRLHGKKIPGTGVGLAICQRVVERYGGRIWVESQVGQGATFFLALPGIGVHSAGETE